MARASLHRTLVAATLVSFTALPAAGQPAGDAAAGRRLAERWCASCHAVAPGRASDTAPAFATMARDPKRTEAYLRAWLQRPHPRMPDFNLGRDEIDDLLAYLRTLKAAK